MVHTPQALTTHKWFIASTTTISSAEQEQHSSIPWDLGGRAQIAWFQSPLLCLPSPQGASEASFPPTALQRA